MPISKPLPGTPLNWAHPLNRGLVGYWPFWEGAGLRACDLSPYGNHGTLTNMVQGSTSGWCGGMSSQAMCFDGVNDFVTVTESASLDVIGPAITFGGWINPTGSADYQMIVGKDVSSVSRQYALFLTLGNTSQVYVALSGVTTVTNAGANLGITSPWVVGKWNCLFVTYQSGVGGVVYLNGVPVYSSAWSGTITHLASAIHIGGEGSDNLFHTTGRIDGVRVYNRALTQSDIWSLYSQP